MEFKNLKVGMICIYKYVYTPKPDSYKGKDIKVIIAHINDNNSILVEFVNNPNNEGHSGEGQCELCKKEKGHWFVRLSDLFPLNTLKELLD